MDVLGLDREQSLGRRHGAQASLLMFTLVSAIMLLSSLYAAEATVFKKAREAVLETASPVLEFLSAPIAWIHEQVGAFGDYFFVLEQNKALREENRVLRQWEEEARSLRAVVATFEKLEGYHAPTKVTPITGFVVGESSDAYGQSMIVNAGARSGVAAGQAVLDDLGLVGRIVEVSDNAARILLLNSVQSRIPVLVEGSYVEGLMIGRSSERPAIETTKLADGDRIQKGQRVVTSGEGDVLPRGLPVGVIADIRDGVAVIDLTADYARTRLVRVINYDFPKLTPTPPPADAPPAAAPVEPAAATAAPATTAAARPAATSAPAAEAGPPTEFESEGDAPPPEPTVAPPPPAAATAPDE